jgi:hypothetical protein
LVQRERVVDLSLATHVSGKREREGERGREREEREREERAFGRARRSSETHVRTPTQIKSVSRERGRESACTHTRERERIERTPRERQREGGEREETGSNVPTVPRVWHQVVRST